MRQIIVEDSPADLRRVMVRYYDNGFKRWGNPATKKTKVFILGDSFTEMYWVSNGEEWYSCLQERFPGSEFFVYGARGFGSLQEFMVLSDYIGEIKPDIIILQFCYNDFYDNLHALDVTSYPFNVQGIRPYLEEGRTVFRMTVPFPWLREHSFTADLILYLYDKAIKKITARNFAAVSERRSVWLERAVKRDKKLAGLNEEAFKVTEKIMLMIRKKAGNIPVYFLDVSRPDDPRGLSLCRAAGFIYIPGIREYLAREEKEGNRIALAHDKHWNALGNKLAGEMLAEYFAKRGLK
ncbi:MAG: SGNH/GDSL hydrolase family protein [Desulfocucumaceae bacterium]